jgi:bifunctional isochorismate lyase/aryl carrier protein
VKEEYFTLANISARAAALLAGMPVRRKAGPDFSPQKSALLVLDMQEYFLKVESHAWVPSARAILPGIQALIAAWTEHGLPVLYTRHVNTVENAAGMATWWRELLTEDNPLSAISPVFDILNGEVFQKSQYDAFYGTRLESRLQALGKTQVVICGVMTHLCCETTARSAFMRGFQVYFPVDGTATYNEKFHRASLLNLAHGFATLTTTGELLKAVHGGEQG